MPALKDLTGQQFGRLTVISRAPNKGRYVCWNCSCSCGNTCIVRAHDLSNNKTQSCGCLYKESRPKAQNLIGKQFGKLTVIKKTELRKDNRPVWECKCICGNLTLVNSHELMSGTRVSCGCKNKSAGESIIETLLQENSINYLFNKGYFTDLLSEKGRILRFDFILLNNDNKPYRLIEFDGEQHFKDLPIFKESLQIRQSRDKIKNNYAKKHNLPLVRIPYWELNNITIEMLLGDTYLV